MNTITTRIAPAGARFGRPSSGHLAVVDSMLARAAAFGGAGRVMASATTIAPDQADPAPPAPNTPADTAARLDAQDTQLADHESRIAGLEQRSPPPVVDTGAHSAPPATAAAAVAPVTRMVSCAAIYARMNAPRPIGLKTAAPTPPASAVIQTSAGPVLNARAIHDRNNAIAAARAGR